MLAPCPSTIETRADVTALEAAARVERTLCGQEDIAWHVWDAGEPVVFLHGGAGRWTHWVRTTGALLRAGRSVFVPDMPCFGDSASAPDEYQPTAAHQSPQSADRTPAQHALCICTGGQATDPKEQNTQQSPGFGRSNAWHPSHS
jgi:pimeloyl-ACP methyl ester carboxylesterase